MCETTNKGHRVERPGIEDCVTGRECWACGGWVSAWCEVLDPSDGCAATVCVGCADDAANGFEVIS